MQNSELRVAVPAGIRPRAPAADLEELLSRLHSHQTFLLIAGHSHRNAAWRKANRHKLVASRLPRKSGAIQIGPN